MEVGGKNIKINTARRTTVIIVIKAGNTEKQNPLVLDWEHYTVLCMLLTTGTIIKLNILILPYSPHLYNLVSLGYVYIIYLLVFTYLY